MYIRSPPDPKACVPAPQPMLQQFLCERLPASVTVHDVSLDTIALLRVLHALNKHWASMYDVSHPPQAVQSSLELSLKSFTM